MWCLRILNDFNIPEGPLRSIASEIYNQSATLRYHSPRYDKLCGSFVHKSLLIRANPCTRASEIYNQSAPCVSTVHGTINCVGVSYISHYSSERTPELVHQKYIISLHPVFPQSTFQSQRGTVLRFTKAGITHKTGCKKLK